MNRIKKYALKGELNMAKTKWRGGTLLAPVPPALVTCKDGDRENVLTIAWTGIVNSDPPKTYISVRPSRYSYDIIKNSGVFAINLTTKALVRAADWCGVRTGAKLDKFERCRLLREKANEIDCPILAASPLVLECRVTDIVPLGTHDMFLAEIVAVHVDEALIDENGKLQGDLSTFPHGIKWLVEKVNSMGLKLGIYSSNGTLTCEDLPASLYNERIDAETFAEWGIEYFKYDYCHHVLIPTDAPYIDSISIIGNSLDKELIFKAKDANLKGDAKVVIEGDGNSYVKGLCSGLGTIEFNNVEVPEDGEYVLTLVMKKNTSKGQFCVVTVNDNEKYDFYIAEQKAFSREGRRQIKIRLKAGRNSISIFEKIGYDLEYIDNYGLFEDIKIIFLTVKTVLTKEGADAGKSTIQNELEDLKNQNSVFQQFFQDYFLFLKQQNLQFYKLLSFVFYSLPLRQECQMR